jgi:hypothetical protein
MALFIIPLVLMVNSCKKDDPVPIVIVVAERSTGKLFIVNSTNAARTEVAQVNLVTGEPLTNIRGMVYHGASKKIFASTTNDGGGNFYVINPKTMEAELINANPDDHWYGIADLLVTGENKILSTLWYKNSHTGVGSKPGFQKFNTDGSAADQDYFSNDNLCCGLGIVFGSNNSEVLIASYPLEIHKSTLDGETELLTTLTLSGFDVEDDEQYAIQNMVKNSKGKIYATVYCWEDELTYLAEVNLTTSTLRNIGALTIGDTNRYHGLMLISKDLL